MSHAAAPSSGESTGPGPPRRGRTAAAVGGLGALAAAGVWLAAGLGAAGLVVRGLFLVVVAWAGVGLFAWSRGGTARFGLVTASGALALVGLEVGLRFVPGPHVRPEERALAEFDPRLGWRYRPGAEGVYARPWECRTLVRINAAGFRGPLRDPSPEERVAVLGDSSVANLAVASEEVFTARLQERTGDAVEVRNYGVSGYGPVQELLLLERGTPRPRAALADGRLVVSGGALTEPDRARPLAERLCEAAVVRLLTGLTRLGRNNLESLPPDARPPELRYGAWPLPPAEAEAFRTTAAVLRAFFSRCREAGARPALVLAPSLWQLEGRWGELVARYGVDPAVLERARLHDDLAAAAAEAGVPCLDLLPALDALGPEAHFPWEQHWTAAGNARVAERLGAWLAAEGLLPDGGERGG